MTVAAGLFMLALGGPARAQSQAPNPDVVRAREEAERQRREDADDLRRGNPGRAASARDAAASASKRRGTDRYPADETRGAGWQPRPAVSEAIEVPSNAGRWGGAGYSRSSLVPAGRDPSLTVYDGGGYGGGGYGGGGYGGGFYDGGAAGEPFYTGDGQYASEPFGGYATPYSTGYSAGYSTLDPWPYSQRSYPFGAIEYTRLDPYSAGYSPYGSAVRTYPYWYDRPTVSYYSSYAYPTYAYAYSYPVYATPYPSLYPYSYPSTWSGLQYSGGSYSSFSLFSTSPPVYTTIDPYPVYGGGYGSAWYSRDRRSEGRRWDGRGQGWDERDRDRDGGRGRGDWSGRDRGDRGRGPGPRRDAAAPQRDDRAPTSIPAGPGRGFAPVTSEIPAGTYTPRPQTFPPPRRAGGTQSLPGRPFTPSSGSPVAPDPAPAPVPGPGSGSFTPITPPPGAPPPGQPGPRPADSPRPAPSQITPVRPAPAPTPQPAPTRGQLAPAGPGAGPSPVYNSPQPAPRPAPGPSPSPAPAAAPAAPPVGPQPARR